MDKLIDCFMLEQRYYRTLVPCLNCFIFRDCSYNQDSVRSISMISLKFICLYFDLCQSSFPKFVNFMACLLSNLSPSTTQEFLPLQSFAPFKHPPFGHLVFAPMLDLKVRLGLAYQILKFKE